MTGGPATSAERYNIFETEQRWGFDTRPERDHYACDALRRYAVAAGQPMAISSIAPLNNAPDWACLLDSYGHDVLRLCVLSDTPLTQPAEWNNAAPDGAWRFIHRLWRTVQGAQSRLPTVPAVPTETHSITPLVHEITQAVTHDFQTARLHTAIARLRTLTHTVESFFIATPAGLVAKHDAIHILLRLFHPIIPTITAELWAQLGNARRLDQMPWPVVSKTAGPIITTTVQTPTEQQKQAAIDDFHPATPSPSLSNGHTFHVMA